MAMTPAQVKKVICERFKGDKIRPEEVILHPSGHIIIDRRKLDPRAKPIVVGKWS